ncbi:MAG: glycoside hydrolase family 2 protein, partial [Bacteroidota bacterium]
MRYSLIVVILLVLGCQPKHDVPLTFQLNKNWQFKRVTDTVWRSAVVPGNVFSDLLEHNLIEDPFVSDIEKKVQWVSDTEWEYRTFFSLDKGTLSKKNIDLFFEGLDTYAEVYLNNNLILEANNAFREWHIDAKRMLKTKNELRIRFKPTYKFERLEKQKLPYILPEGNRIFTRK